jgi:hypothetical protein
MIDWHDPYVLEHFDERTSQLVKIVLGPRVPPILASRQVDVAIDMLWPADASADAEVPSLPPAAVGSPAAPPAPRKMVSDADVRRAVQAAGERYPPGVRRPAEKTLREELEREVGALVERDRFRQALKDHAPHLKLPRGRPRKSAQ